jgi:uncharacterized protein
LEELGYTPKQVNNICFAIAWHVDGNAGFQHPVTLEAKCVTDADNIDRFGAYRILQWCVPEMDDFPALVTKLTARVELLQEYHSRRKMLETNTGDRMFKNQLIRQIDFFQYLIDEYQITKVPNGAKSLNNDIY